MSESIEQQLPGHLRRAAKWIRSTPSRGRLGRICVVRRHPTRHHLRLSYWRTDSADIERHLMRWVSRPGTYAAIGIAQSISGPDGTRGALPMVAAIRQDGGVVLASTDDTTSWLRFIGEPS